MGWPWHGLGPRNCLTVLSVTDINAKCRAQNQLFRETSTTRLDGDDVRGHEIVGGLQ